MYIAGLIVLLLILLLALGLITLELYINKKFKSLKLLYEVDETKRINIQKNLVYKKTNSKNLLMDVYSPASENREEKFPAIFFIHGEGIERMLKDVKEWGFYTSYGKLAASKGFVGITFHRNRTNLNFRNKDVADDILDAVNFVRSNSDQLNVDKNRICIWSFSMGGLYLSRFLHENPDYIRCIISYYGLLDIKYRAKKITSENEMYQPENYLPEKPDNIPPLLIVKAEKDKIKGINASQESFMQTASSRNIPFELISHKTGGHTFDGLDDNEETTEIINRTWDFIDKHI